LCHREASDFVLLNHIDRFSTIASDFSLRILQKFTFLSPDLRPAVAFSESSRIFLFPVQKPWSNPLRVGDGALARDFCEALILSLRLSANWSKECSARLYGKEYMAGHLDIDISRCYAFIAFCYSRYPKKTRQGEWRDDIVSWTKLFFAGEPALGCACYA
jgi:hypothetical protein